ncbi:hypothetical protein SRHO_G00240190 [Serrasalmus rhombeus]
MNILTIATTVAHLHLLKCAIFQFKDKENTLLMMHLEATVILCEPSAPPQSPPMPPSPLQLPPRPPSSSSSLVLQR